MTDRDEEREQRIEMRVIVDAYTVEEQAYGWHAYLDDVCVVTVTPIPWRVLGNRCVPTELAIKASSDFGT